MPPLFGQAADLAAAFDPLQRRALINARAGCQAIKRRREALDALRPTAQGLVAASSDRQTAYRRLDQLFAEETRL